MVSLSGEQFNYIATNYGLIQQVIEEVSGMDYLSYLRTYQFDSLGIDDISFGSSFEVKPQQGPTYSLYHTDPITGAIEKGTDLQKIRETFFPSLYADAGAFATLGGLGQWIMHLQTGGFISANGREAMWTAQPDAEGGYQGFGGFLNGYSIGWPVMHREQHAGVMAIGGGRAALAIYPKEGLTIILLTNLTGSSPHRIVEKLAPLLWE
ncbi:MAG: serine hydrolase domain-containing protein [Bacteroidota bacterium]